MLSAIGSTPLVELRRLVPDAPFRLYAKLEGMNPGGSMKDRAAFSMLGGLIADGTIVPGKSVVVESSSGNLAIGLAQVCCYFGVRLICVVDPRTTEQNVAILRAYGAEVDMVTEPDPKSGEYLPERLRRVRRLVSRIPHAYWPNQYGNLLNARAHERTMAEIAEALSGQVDYLFVATSSCGTLRGCADYVRRAGLGTRIVAVDAQGSGIFTAPSGSRRIPGHGAAMPPALLIPDLADEVALIADADCVRGCRRLVASEAVLAGGSAGAVVAALLEHRFRIPAGANCVMVLADRGDRYLDTVYCDSWVRDHLGLDAADLDGSTLDGFPAPSLADLPGPLTALCDPLEHLQSDFDHKEPAPC
ncbi:2,3-diaminopropionate biosynthesis protein SbnA [Kitasatospora camelliae]|uniref:N-(2-amino-2-carboxyethyl)-L-glutamate synthase n=1 Tax=Kitasatospora camelliae TaxID=3156397 RepID=A0AAU8K656_9ACTN